MKKKLQDILEFLEENEKYNTKLQYKYMETVLCSKQSRKEKIIAMLYDTASTQSQPKIDKLAPLFIKIAQSKESFNTFNDFLNFFNEKGLDNDLPYKSLFEGLKKEDGWGVKTSALFVKNIYNLHYNDTFKKYKLWDDIPKLKDEDRIYLPVDAVILAIFYKINPTPPKWSFSRINKQLKTFGFSNEQIIRFDDLWFWGFITQDNSKGNDENQEYWDKTRKMSWNTNKYWMIKESNKEEKYIAEIKQKTERFLELFMDKEN